MSDKVFVLQAVVEAVPQSMIHLIAITMSRTLRDADVIQLSILISAFMIAHGGYLLSFSIFQSTLVFNCASAAAIAADVFGAFAVITWLINGFLVDYSGPNGFEWAMIIMPFVIVRLVATVTILTNKINGFLEDSSGPNGFEWAMITIPSVIVKLVATFTVIRLFIYLFTDALLVNYFWSNSFESAIITMPIVIARLVVDVLLLVVVALPLFVTGDTILPATLRNFINGRNYVDVNLDSPAVFFYITASVMLVVMLALMMRITLIPTLFDFEASPSSFISPLTFPIYYTSY